MTIGDRIRTIRTEKELSQTDLAKLAGYYDKTVISKFEHAGNDISMKQVRRIAKALNVSPSFLMGWGHAISGHDEGEIITMSSLQGISEEEQKARELFELYEQASPEVQQAVELILRSSQSKS